MQVTNLGWPLMKKENCMHNQPTGVMSLAESDRILRETKSEQLDREIAQLEKRTADLKELKEILESEPKLGRALEIISKCGGIY